LWLVKEKTLRTYSKRVCVQIWLGGSPNQTRLAETFMERVKLQNLEAVLEPLFHLWRRERQTGEAFGDFTHKLVSSLWFLRKICTLMHPKCVSHGSADIVIILNYLAFAYWLLVEVWRCCLITTIKGCSWWFSCCNVSRVLQFWRITSTPTKAQTKWRSQLLGELHNFFFTWH
jgi:hypothetical protein